jgi:hypothetical protein
VLTTLRRILNHQLSVATLLEGVLWFAVPYILVGLAWTFFHPGQMHAIETRLQTTLPAGADLVVFGAMTALWPMFLITSSICAA